VDRWHLASRELVSGRVEKLALKVARHEDTKRRSGEEARSHPSEKDRWRRSKDLANSGARRVRTQVLGIQSHEDVRSKKVITVGSGSRRTVGSARGIVHRSLARKGSRTWPRKSRSREGARSRVSAS
jgi:hypothetical protein